LKQTRQTSSAKGWNNITPPGLEAQGRNRSNSGGAKASPRTLTPEALETKTTELLEEFFSSFDVTEAIECIRELNTPSYYPEVVKQCILIAIEGKENDRDRASKLLGDLYLDKVIFAEELAKG
jgi:translation initiation factor 4G